MNSKRLSSFKQAMDKTYHPTRLFVVDLYVFIKNSVYWKIWACMLILYAGGFSIALETLAFFSYFSSSFDLSSIYNWIYKIVYDLALFFEVIPTLLTVIILVVAYELLCRYLGYYQYTVIDEATRKRFIRAYKEQSQESTIDFIIRAIKFFRYKPRMIQTDNGQEFTFLKGETKDGRIHKFDHFCIHFGIKHKLIRPRTPRHNGKVERSHRNDNERFYRYLRYYSFDDLQSQMTVYLRRSNDIPSAVLRSANDKKRWLSPNEKEAELLHR